MGELVKVLLIDDNPQYLEKVLPYYGFEVVCAYNGEEGLQILENHSDFDIILLDVMMPVKNGWDTLKEIKTNPVISGIPIIMVTAVSQEQKIVKGLKLGADDYITKPFQLPVLLARIEAVLRRYKSSIPKVKSKNVTIHQIQNFNRLTDREKDVLLLVTQGKSNKAIAESLVISLTTVKSYLYKIFKKLEVKNRLQASIIAAQAYSEQLL